MSELIGNYSVFYFFREDLRKEDLQLMSIVILQIIAKIYELRPPNYEEMSHLCSRSYSAEEFKKCEAKSMYLFGISNDLKLF